MTYLTKKDLEDYLDDTVSIIKDLDERSNKMDNLLGSLPDISDMVQESLKTQTILATAANSISATLQKMEERQAKLEDINTALYKTKGLAPNVVILLIGALLLTIIMLVAASTNSYIKGTATGIEIGSREALEQIKGTDNGN